MRLGFFRRSFDFAAVRTRERHEEEDAGSNEIADGTRSTDFEDWLAFDAMVMRVAGIPLYVGSRMERSKRTGTDEGDRDNEMGM